MFFSEELRISECTKSLIPFPEAFHSMVSSKSHEEPFQIPIPFDERKEFDLGPPKQLSPNKAIHPNQIFSQNVSVATLNMMNQETKRSIGLSQLAVVNHQCNNDFDTTLSNESTYYSHNNNLLALQAYDLDGLSTEPSHFNKSFGKFSDPACDYPALIENKHTSINAFAMTEVQKCSSGANFAAQPNIHHKDRTTINDVEGQQVEPLYVPAPSTPLYFGSTNNDSTPLTTICTFNEGVVVNESCNTPQYTVSCSTSGLELQKILSFNPAQQQGESNQTPSMTSTKNSVASFLSRNETSGTPTIPYTEFPKSRYMERKREKAIRDMVKVLADILPYQVCKATRPAKVTILEKAAEYITTMIEDIEILKHKLKLTEEYDLNDCLPIKKLLLSDASEIFSTTCPGIRDASEKEQNKLSPPCPWTSSPLVNELYRKEEILPQVLMLQPLKQITEQECDMSPLSNPLVTTSDVKIINSNLISNHHSSNLQMDLRVAPQTLIGDFVASPNLHVDEKKGEEELSTISAVDKVSMESRTRVGEECQNRDLNSTQNIKAIHNSLLISSSLANNTDEITDLCRIKRPMNAFMLFSNDNRGKVCAANPELDNKSISKVLGKQWKELPVDKKMFYRNRFYNELEKIKANFPGWSFSSYRYRKQQQKGHCKAIHPSRPQKKNIRLHQRADKASMKEQFDSLANCYDTIPNGLKGTSESVTPKDLLARVGACPLWASVLPGGAYFSCS